MSDLHKSILCCLAGIAAALVFCMVLSRRADEAGRHISNLDVRLFVLEANEQARQRTNEQARQRTNEQARQRTNEIPNDIRRWRASDDSNVYWLTVEVGLLRDSSQLVWRNHTN